MAFGVEINYHMPMEKDAQKLRDKEEATAKSRADLLRVSYTDTRKLDKSEFYPELINIDQIDRYKVVPVAADVSKLQFGFSLQTPQTSLEEVQKLYPEHRVFFTYISQSGYDEIRQRYYDHAHRDDPKPPSPEEIASQLANQVLETSEQIKQSEEIDLFGEELDAAHQTELFNFIAQQAYLLNSSDIHIEPKSGSGGARIRFRIDGRLHVVGNIEAERYKLLLNEIQMKARVRWNADYPQTGNIKVALFSQNKEQTDVNMRVETVPTLHGSDIVMRIFNIQEEYLNLDNLGLNPEQRQSVDELISQPHGLFLAVGPTGSGKSSTLYSIIRALNTEEVKIVTLEDPVEYQIDGITQIPVSTDDEQSDTDEAFMTRLRAVLREDPDIIMIGEIRDEETARTALQASLTGHLVLSTFHANNGASAVSRLLDIIDYNPLLISAVRLIMPQRLIRRLCPDCKQAYQPDENLAGIIARAMQGVEDQPEEITLYKPVGCDQCHHIGYRGRISIFEQFRITSEMKNAIAENHHITVQRLEELAIANGMTTLLQDGISKAIAGETSIEEVFRVVDLQQ